MDSIVRLGILTVQVLNAPNGIKQVRINLNRFLNDKYNSKMVLK